MIKFFGQAVGEVIGDKSYFYDILYNNKEVKTITVNGVPVAYGGYIAELNELRQKGCEKVFEVYEAHEEILYVVQNAAFMKYDGASYFKLENDDEKVVPSYTDTVGIKFVVNESYEGVWQTLYCSRTSSSVNTFTAFMSPATSSTPNKIRADFGTGTTAVGQQKYSLSLNRLYELQHKNGLTLLNSVEASAPSSDEFTPVNPVMLGAGYENYASGTVDKYATKYSFNSFYIMGTDGMYKAYIVPFVSNKETNECKLVDLVTGIEFTHGGTGTPIMYVTDPMILSSDDIEIDALSSVTIEEESAEQSTLDV